MSSAGDILNSHGAEFVGFYGRWAWQAMEAGPADSTARDARDKQSAGATTRPADLEAKKAAVTAFYDLMFNQSDPAEAVRRYVSDLPRSLEYYELVIGPPPLAIEQERAVLGCKDGRVLAVLHTRTGVTPARRGAFGVYHFAILLPDWSALGRFAAHIASLGIRIGMADHLVSESLYLSDPDGLGI